MRIAAFAVLATVVLAGCTTTTTPTVASAQRPDPGPAVSSPPASPSAPESDYDKALRYARCTNEHGTKMADPVVGEPLQTGDVLPGGWQAQTNDAFETCKQFLPATWPVKVDPAELAKEKAFDECMRKRGVAVPEPDANGMIAYPTDPHAQDQALVESAVAACRYLYDDPANNQ
ncbi:hypothetical protein AB0K00_04050 [Dactylosporangium sp. NPDC049525]|uniref:hypothetical protein n=1 Tax=Dactylosporangium sp. NPDC049525 TaxID=3154730 RepID=UPI00341A21C9